MKITIEVDLATGAVSATRGASEGATETTADVLSTPPSIGVNAEIGRASCRERVYSGV